MSDAQINTIVKTILKKETDLSDGYNKYLPCSKKLLENKLIDIAKLMLINMHKEEIRKLESQR